MPSWFLYAFLAFVSWGIWAFFVKLATGHLTPKTVYFYEIIGMIAALLVSFLWTGWPKEFHTKGAIFAVLAGIFIVIGEPLFILAVQKGKASVVTMLVTLYPLLTAVLVFLILRETVTIKQGIGMLFAMVAMILFAV